MAEKTVLHVEGMTCTHCAQGIARFLENKGLKEVFVDFPSGEVSFSDELHVNQGEISDGISKLGYRVVTSDPGALRQKKSFEWNSLEVRLGICALFTIPLLLHMVLHMPLLHNPWFQLAFTLPVMFIGMMHFGKSALASLRTGHPNMDVLITLGSLSAFFYSIAGIFLDESQTGHYLFFETAATIITLVLLGNLIEKKSVNRTTSAIRELAALQPQLANRITISSGLKEEITTVAVTEIKKGDAILVNQGGVVPMDGTIYWGNGQADEAALTGESIPAEKNEGDVVLAGSTLVSGSIKLKVEKTSGQTVLANIIELVKQARLSKPQIQKLGDKVSSWFVPAVVLISAVTFMVWITCLDKSFSESLMSAVAVLVISCPCAMGLATPTAVAVGLGKAARSGIVVKGGATLEQLSSIRTAVFDKTGTLTTGEFRIAAINATGISKGEAESVLYSIEQYSSHPIAKSLVAELKKTGAVWLPMNKVEESKGNGITGVTTSGDTYFVGSYRSLGKTFSTDDSHNLYLTKNGELVATLDLADEVRTGAADTIGKLEQMGIRCVLLSGDTQKRCESLAQKVGIDRVYSEKLPHEKTELVSQLKKDGPVLMIGDGINDAPSLTSADVGMSFADATRIAMNSASVILLKGSAMDQIPLAVKAGRQTMKTIKQNLFWAFFYNVVAIPIAAAGMLSPMVAAFSMAFSDVVVIGNSLRLRFIK